MGKHSIELIDDDENRDGVEVYIAQHNSHCIGVDNANKISQCVTFKNTLTQCLADTIDEPVH